MEAELPEPVVHRLFVHLAELLGLQDRNSLCPAPDECPERPNTQTHVLEPRMGEQREVPPTPWAPVPIFLPPDMP